MKNGLLIDMKNKKAISIILLILSAICVLGVIIFHNYITKPYSYIGLILGIILSYIAEYIYFKK